ncbi:MAG: hypothetical protein PHH28_03280 [Desulfuromonadaceae bacterium]|nr:hypothetical protein [Desulfuromonadaceae bacterium]
MQTGRKIKILAMAGCISLFIVMQAAYGAESWRTEFDATCSQATDAMALSVPELQKLIERCVSLQKIIEREEETVRKVYLKRLQMCKKFYIFVLDSKIREQKPQ